MVTRDDQTLNSYLSAVNLPCSANDSAGCRNALIQLQGFVTQARVDLDQVPVPECLQAVNDSLVGALSQLATATSEGIFAVNENDQTQWTAAGFAMNSAANGFALAASQAAQAAC